MSQVRLLLPRKSFPLTTPPLNGTWRGLAAICLRLTPCPFCALFVFASQQPPSDLFPLGQTQLRHTVVLSVSKRVACVSSCLCCSPFNCRCGSPVCRGRITGMYFLHARARIHAFCIVRERGACKYPAHLRGFVNSCVCDFFLCARSCAGVVGGRNCARVTSPGPSSGVRIQRSECRAAPSIAPVLYQVCVS